MENDLRRVVDALPGLVWTARHDGQVDFVNQHWCDYTGLGVDKAYGSGWQAVIHPDDLPGLREAWAAIVTSGELREMEARLRRADGEYRWFLLQVSRLTDASGQVVKWCGMSTDIDDRKRAGEDLRARERRFRWIVDGLPAVVTLMTPEGELEDANQHMLEYFGATLEELKARPTTQSFHPDDRPDVDARWKVSVETGRSYNFEARLRRADGVYRWFHTRGFPLRDSEGHIVLWHLLQIDVDDRKRGEALLAGEKQLLELVAGGYSLPGTLDTLCHLVETMVSECFCSIVLVDPSGTKLQEAIAPSLPSTFNDAVRDWPVDRRGGPCAMAATQKIQVIMSDVVSDTRWRNSWRALTQAHGLRSCWSTPILDTNGKVLGTFAMYYGEPRTPTVVDQGLIERFTHIAGIAIQRAQREAALRQSEAFLAEAQRELSLTLDSIPVLVWSAGLDGSAEFFNHHYLEYLGLSLEQAQNWGWSVAVHPDDLSGLTAIWQVILASGKPGEAEARLRRADGEYRWFLFRANPLRDERGQIVKWYGVNTDIEDRKRAEEGIYNTQAELAHMTRVMTIGALTASIAHEVNQPLAGIMTNASTCLRMLAADPPNIDGARETAQRTIRDAIRASEVIKRLRELFAKRGPSSESIDLNEAAHEVIVLSWSELQRSRVIVQTEFAEDLPRVTGDRVQLQQVILNLLRNALDALNEVHDRPRQLLIRTEIDGAAQVRLTVQDSGEGFAPQAANKIFEAFYSTKSNGTGIGLSISRSIVESHHGRLWAARNDGPGATFSFSIPLKSETSSLTAAASAP